METWLRWIPIVSTPRIQQRKLRHFLSVFILFLLLSPIVLWAIELFSVRTYFIVSFVWLLICSEVFAPTDLETIWWRRLQWLKAGGWIVFIYIVVERVIAVVQ